MSDYATIVLATAVAIIMMYCCLYILWQLHKSARERHKLPSEWILMPDEGTLDDLERIRKWEQNMMDVDYIETTYEVIR